MREDLCVLCGKACVCPPCAVSHTPGCSLTKRCCHLCCSAAKSRAAAGTSAQSASLAVQSPMQLACGCFESYIQQSTTMLLLLKL